MLTATRIATTMCHTSALVVTSTGLSRCNAGRAGPPLTSRLVPQLARLTRQWHWQGSSHNQRGSHAMRKLTTRALASGAIAAAGFLAWNADATTLARAATVPSAAQNCLPIERVACGVPGRYCPAGRHWVYDPYYCWSAPCYYSRPHPHRPYWYLYWWNPYRFHPYLYPDRY